MRDHYDSQLLMYCTKPSLLRDIRLILLSHIQRKHFLHAEG